MRGLDSHVLMHGQCGTKECQTFAIWAAEALAGFDHRLSVLEDWRAFLHNHAVFEHPSDPQHDRYILAVHNMAGA